MSRVLRSAFLLATLVLTTLLAGCGQVCNDCGGTEPYPPDPPTQAVEAVWTRPLGTGSGITPRFVELGPGRGLDRLLPPWALHRLGHLDDLPARPHGQRRNATVLSGCRETSTPRLAVLASGPSAYFPHPSTVNCVAAEFTVAVFDVSPQMADRVLAGGPSATPQSPGIVE